MKNYWPVKKLGEVVKLINGRTFKSSEWRLSGIPIIRIQNLNNSDAPFNYFGGKYADSNYIRQNDLLFSWSGSIGTSFGAHIWNGPDGLLNQHIFKVDIDHSEINKSYLYFFLNKIIKDIEKKAHGGAGLVHITKSELEKIPILLPVFAEQKKIVERLDAIRKAQELCDQQIQKTAELFESLLVKELSNLDKSQIKKLNDLCIKITDGAHKTPTYISTGIPFLSVRNMINGVVDFTECKFISNTEHNQLTKRCSPEFEDILIAKSGTTGVATLVNIKKQFSLFVSVALLKPNRDLIQSKFLVYFLNSESGKRQMAVRTKGGIVKNLHIEEIRELEVPVPSQENQQEIIEKLEAVQNYKKLLLKQKELLKELFDSVLDKSMKGELDS